MAYEITLLTTMSIAVLFALSLNVITGFCGQVSLGHAAFFGIGAYTAAMLTKAGTAPIVGSNPDLWTVAYITCGPCSAVYAGWLYRGVGHQPDRKLRVGAGNGDANCRYCRYRHLSIRL